MANVYSYNDYDDLIFTGISLIDSSIELKHFNNELQKIFFYSKPANIKINDIEWKIKERECPAVVKLILETQIATINNSSNVIETLQFIIPNAKLLKNNSINFDAQPLLTRNYYQKDKPSEEFYGYMIAV